ncbi:MAG: RCC1 domain-containing protein [Bacillota bacterium]
MRFWRRHSSIMLFVAIFLASSILGLFTPAKEASATPNTWTQKTSFAYLHDRGLAAGNGQLYMLGGLDDSGSPYNYFYKYDPQSNSWSTASGWTGYNRYYNKMVQATNGNIYMFGGYDSGYAYDSGMWEYNPLTSQWTRKATLTTGGRYYHTMAAGSNRKIYVLGGYNPSLGTYSRDLWEYDPVANTWTQKTTPPLVSSGGIYGAALAGSDNGKLYLWGGYIDGWGVSDNTKVYVYDIASNTWATITTTSYPTARYYFTMDYISGRLLVFGGLNGGYLSDLWEFNTSTNTWTSKATGPAGRYSHASAMLNNKLYILGGYGSSGTLNDLWQYDPAPPAPGTPTLASTTTSITANWAANGNPVGTYYKAEILGPTGAAITDSGWQLDQMSFTFSGLDPGVQYGVHVKAMKDGSESDWSATANQATPLGTPTGRRAGVAGGGSHTIAFKSNMSAWSWGYNGYGELGDNTYTNRTTPVQITGSGGIGTITNVVSVAAGDSHSLALKSDGTVWALGYNSNGQLGDTTTTNRPAPVQVSGLTSIAAVAAGSAHSLALKSDGTVWAWGAGSYGVLGDNAGLSRSSPVQVKGAGGSGYLTNVVAIASGGYISLALKSDGTVWAWGNNSAGQLGDGTVNNRLAPVQVSGLTNVVAVAAASGGSHSVALKSDGTVWTWGYNYYGQLGDGTTTDKYTPVQVKGVGGSGYLTGVVSVAAGGTHSLALRSDGTIWAWGYNTYGQLGNNSTGSSSTPVQVLDTGGTAPLTGIVKISAGTYHSVALKTSGNAVAWGYGAYGQLGFSSNNYSNYAYAVPVYGPLQTAPAAPGTPTVTAGAGSLSLFWTNGGNPTGTYYRAWITDASGIPFTNSGLLLDQTSYVFNNLAGRTTYKAYVEAVAPPVAIATALITKDTLAAVPSLTATGTSQTSVNITIDTKGNPAGTTYEIDRGSTAIYTGTGTSTTDTGLTANTGYSYKVRAQNLDSTWTSYSSNVTGYSLPYVPSISSVSNSGLYGALSITINSNGNPVGTTYEIERYDSAANSVSVYTGTNTSYTDNNMLYHNRMYQYRVRARTPLGDPTAWSSYSGAYYPYPATPTGLTVTSRTSNGFSLSWTANDSTTSMYYFWYVNRTSDNAQVGSSNVYQTTTATTTGSAPNERDLITIRSYSGTTGYWGQSPGTQIYAYSAANQPSSLTATATNNSIMLSWSSNGNPMGTNYKVYKGTTPGTLIYTGTNATFTDTGLSPGTSYHYEVTAVNGDSIETSRVTIDKTTAPPAPIVSYSYGQLPWPDTWSNSGGRGWVTLSWNTIAGATGYKVKLWDGYAWREFTTTQTSWDSRTAKIYPGDSTLSGYGNNSITSDVFNHSQTGLDLRDTPNLLYQKTAGTTNDANNYYRFKVAAYNSSGDGDSNELQITLPNRTDTTVPTSSVVINDGQALAPGKMVKVKVTGSDPVITNYTPEEDDDISGLFQMRLSNDNSNWSDWKPFGTSINALPISTSFEELQGAHTGILSGQKTTIIGNNWSFVTNNTSATIEIKGDGGATGRRYARITHDVTVGKKSITQGYQITGGKWYRVTAYVRTNSPTAITPGGFGFYSDTFTSGITWSKEIKADNGWIKGATVFQAPSTLTGAFYVYGIDNGANGLTVDYDFVVVEEFDTQPTGEMVPDGSFYWTLDTSTYGKKTVYVQVKDTAGNVKTVTGEISFYLVDTQAPTVTVTANNGNPYTSGTTIPLKIDAKDDMSPADQLVMRFSNDFASWTDWETYVPYRNYTLTGLDGTKTIYVQLKDASGNVGTGYTQITLRTSQTAPIEGNINSKFTSTSGASGMAVVGGQAVNVRYTQGTEISLNLDPALNPSSVQYSMDNLRWLSSEPYVQDKIFTLPDYEGFKTVYVRLPDGTTYSQKFVVDRTPPKIEEVKWKYGASATTSTTAILEITASDNFSPDSELKVSTDKVNWSAYTGEVTVTVPGSTGYHTITVYVKDAAGNISKVSKSIWKLAA